jgi:hypothetical protein
VLGEGRGDPVDGVLQDARRLFDGVTRGVDEAGQRVPQAVFDAFALVLAGAGPLAARRRPPRAR